MFTTHQLAQGFATIHRSYEVFQVFANSIVVPTPSFSVPQIFSTRSEWTSHGQKGHQLFAQPLTVELRFHLVIVVR